MKIIYIYIYRERERQRERERNASKSDRMYMCKYKKNTRYSVPTLNVLVFTANPF